MIRIQLLTIGFKVTIKSQHINQVYLLIPILEHRLLIVNNKSKIDQWFLKKTNIFNLDRYKVASVAQRVFQVLNSSKAKGN